MIGIVVVTLGALWLALRAVTVWAAPPLTGPRWHLPMFASPEAGADAGAGAGDDGAHHGSADHGGDVGGDGGGDGGH